MSEGMKLTDRFNRLCTIEGDRAEHRALGPVSPAGVIPVAVGLRPFVYFLSAVVFSSFWSDIIVDA